MVALCWCLRVCACNKGVPSLRWGLGRCARILALRAVLVGCARFLAGFAALRVARARFWRGSRRCVSLKGELRQGLPLGLFRRKVRATCCKAAPASIRGVLRVSRRAGPSWGARRPRQQLGRETLRNRLAVAGTLARMRVNATAACACDIRSRTCSSRYLSRAGPPSEAGASEGRWLGSRGTTRNQISRRSPSIA